MHRTAEPLTIYKQETALPNCEQGKAPSPFFLTIRHMVWQKHGPSFFNFFKDILETRNTPQHRVKIPRGIDSKGRKWILRRDKKTLY
jgi:hypothetical protein